MEFLSLFDGSVIGDLFQLLTTAGQASGANADPAGTICDKSEAILRIVGYVILGIKIIVPIILIIIGMINMAAAIMKQKEEEIKTAQKGLITKAIAAVIVFLIFTIVTLLMTIVGGKDWEKCTKCLNTPGQCGDTGEVLPED